MPTAAVVERPGSRRKSEKGDARDQRKRILPSEKAPLKLKISKNKDVETEKSPENFRLVVSNGKIVR